MPLAFMAQWGYGTGNQHHWKYGISPTFTDETPH